MPTDPSPALDPIFGPVISSYSRQQALADGCLVDVTATAREAGIRFPVALSRAVWNRYVAVPPTVIAQDEAGRLWDILFLFRLAAAAHHESTLCYTVSVRNDNRAPRAVQLKALCGPGDDLDPTITILLPPED